MFLSKGHEKDLAGRRGSPVFRDGKNSQGCGCENIGLCSPSTKNPECMTPLHPHSSSPAWWSLSCILLDIDTAHSWPPAPRVTSTPSACWSPSLAIRGGSLILCLCLEGYLCKPLPQKIVPMTAQWLQTSSGPGKSGNVSVTLWAVTSPSPVKSELSLGEEVPFQNWPSSHLFSWSLSSEDGWIMWHFVISP